MDSGRYGVIRHMMNLEVVNAYEGTQPKRTRIPVRAQAGLQALLPPALSVIESKPEHQVVWSVIKHLHFRGNTAVK